MGGPKYDAACRTRSHTSLESLGISLRSDRPLPGPASGGPAKPIMPYYSFETCDSLAFEYNDPQLLRNRSFNALLMKFSPFVFEGAGSELGASVLGDSLSDDQFRGMYVDFWGDVLGEFDNIRTRATGEAGVSKAARVAGGDSSFTAGAGLLLRLIDTLCDCQGTYVFGLDVRIR